METETINTHTQRDFNRHLERQYLSKMYAEKPVNQEFQASYLAMAEATQIPSNVVSNVMKLLIGKGLVVRRFEKRLDEDGRPSGKKAFWTIKSPYETAEYVLREYQNSKAKNAVEGRSRGLEAAHEARRKVKTNGAAIQDAQPQPITEPVVTEPIADGSISAAQEWVNKTRDYMLNADVITKALEALKAAGVVVDEGMYLQSLSVDHDERLATLALVMPYIDYLESHQK